MALSKNLYKRIFLLSAILIVVELIYVGVRRKFLAIDSIFLSIIELVLTLIISLLVVTVILRFSQNKVWTMFEQEMEVEQRIIISKLYSVSLYTIAFIITFWKAGVSLGNITIFVGLIATGFAFAIRDLLLSFFAWFIILNKKPFQMGDYILLGDDMGLVTRIGTFFFTLEQARKPEFIKVPNSLVLGKSIRNLGEGSFTQELLFPIKSLPEDYATSLQDVINFIKSRSQFKEFVKATISTDQSHWYIKIEYQTSFEQEQLKSATTAEVFRIFNDHVKMTQQ
jgi:small-conductance mechanosensitive channel